MGTQMWGDRWQDKHYTIPQTLTLTPNHNNLAKWIRQEEALSLTQNQVLTQRPETSDQVPRCYRLSAAPVYSVHNETVKGGEALQGPFSALLTPSIHRYFVFLLSLSSLNSTFFTFHKSPCFPSHHVSDQHQNARI